MKNIYCKDITDRLETQISLAKYMYPDTPN